MSKYTPLSNHLRAHLGEEWRATFTEIEQILGGDLPKAARSGRAWWDGEGPHSRAWSDAGWQVGAVDQADEIVVFLRNGAPSAQPVAMRVASEEAARRSRRTLGGGALLAGGVGLVAAGLLAGRNLLRRR